MTRVPLVFVLGIALAGCAMVSSVARRPNHEAELQRGIAAAQAQDYATAREVLEPLYRTYWTEESGRRALMVLTAVELDPRNATRRLYAASDFATTLLNAQEMPSWEKSLAETMYLLSVELGGHEQELDRVEAAKDSAQHAAAAAQRGPLPSSTRESVPTQLRKLREERDALTKRVDALQATVRTRDKDLAEAKAELERIKKVFKIK